MTALLIVIVLEQLLTSSKHHYTYLGFIISLVCLMIFGKDAFLIPAMIGIIMGLSFMYKGEQEHV